jgi:hypothetical protein
MSASRRRVLLRESDRLLDAIEEHFLTGSRRVDDRLARAVARLAAHVRRRVATPRSPASARRAVFAVQELLGMRPDDEQDLAGVLIDMLEAEQRRLTTENSRLVREIDALRAEGADLEAGLRRIRRRLRRELARHTDPAGRPERFPPLAA